MRFTGLITTWEKTTCKEKLKIYQVLMATRTRCYNHCNILLNTPLYHNISLLYNEGNNHQIMQH